MRILNARQECYQLRTINTRNKHKIFFDLVVAAAKAALQSDHQEY